MDGRSYVTRAHIPDPVLAELLVKCARRCALCFGIYGTLYYRRGQVAHVDRDSTNSAIENLAFLCMDHHDEYDTKTSQSKRLLPEELLRYRDTLHAAIERREHVATIAPATAALDAQTAEHDRRAFGHVDQLLPETRVQLYLHRVEAGQLTPSDVVVIGGAIRWCSRESNRFLAPELDGSLEEFVAALKVLLRFTGLNFFPVEGPNRKVEIYRLEVADISEPGGRERYEAALDQGGALAAEVERTYATFRRSVKRLLRV